MVSGYVERDYQMIEFASNLDYEPQTFEIFDMDYYFLSKLMIFPNLRLLNYLLMYFFNPIFVQILSFVNILIMFIYAFYAFFLENLYFMNYAYYQQYATINQNSQFMLNLLIFNLYSTTILIVRIDRMVELQRIDDEIFLNLLRS